MLRGVLTLPGTVAQWTINICYLHHHHRFAYLALPKTDQEQCSILRKQLVVGLLLLFVFDPFNFQEATLAASSQISDRLKATIYRAPSANKIAVVLVDDATLDPSNAYWPPSFAFWSDLLGMLLQLHPAAVYFDISFDYPRPGFSAPDEGPPQFDSVRAADEEAFFASLMSNGFGGPPVPIVLGSLGRLAVRRKPLAHCPNAHRNGERTSVVPTLACAATETTFFDYPEASDRQGYPLWIKWTSQGKIVTSRAPAAALAAIACKALKSAPRWCWTSGTTWLQLPPPNDHRLNDLAVIPRWSLYGAQTNRGCTAYTPGGWWRQHEEWVRVFLSEALAGPLQYLMPGFLAEIQESAGSLKEPCMPFTVVSASLILDHSGEYTNYLKPMLQGRIVLIGDGRRYSPDYVTAPLHKTLPGVMLQATTLETLLTTGPGFPRISDHIRDREARIEVAMRLGIFALALALNGFAKSCRSELRKLPQQEEKLVRWALVVSGARDIPLFERKVADIGLRFFLNNVFNLLFVCLSIGVLALFLDTRYAPSNWVFLIAEIVLISFSLGEVDAPGRPEEKE